MKQMAKSTCTAVCLLLGLSVPSMMAYPAAANDNLQFAAVSNNLAGSQWTGSISFAGEDYVPNPGILNNKAVQTQILPGQAIVTWHISHSVKVMSPSSNRNTWNLMGTLHVSVTSNYSYIYHNCPGQTYGSHSEGATSTSTDALIGTLTTLRSGHVQYDLHIKGLPVHSIVDYTRPVFPSCTPGSHSLSFIFPVPLNGSIDIKGQYDPAAHSISGRQTYDDRLRTCSTVCNIGLKGPLVWNLRNEGHHYLIDIQAWIPQSATVNPLQPLPTPYESGSLNPLSALDPDCFTPPLRDEFTTDVASTFRGDAHVRFGEGTYRLRSLIEFDVDGRSITDLRMVPDVPHVGVTVRDKKYYNRRTGKVIGRCSATGTAPDLAYGFRTGTTSFVIGYSGANPLVPLAFPISNVVRGEVNPDGSLDLTFAATQFPTNGLEVTIDSSSVLQVYETDVSCLSDSAVLKLPAVMTLLWGLGHTYTGMAHAEPGNMAVQTHPSPVCP